MGVFARMAVVAPQTVTLDLGDGQWIEIKRELNYGEMTDVAESTGGKLIRAQLHLLAAYIVGWSLTDGHGKSLPADTTDQRVSALRAMSSEAVNAIDDAITTHIESVKAEKKAEAPSGAPVSAVI